jgi:hypothetical protein
METIWARVTRHMNCTCTQSHAQPMCSHKENNKNNNNILVVLRRLLQFFDTRIDRVYFTHELVPASIVGIHRAQPIVIPFQQLLLLTVGRLQSFDASILLTDGPNHVLEELHQVPAIYFQLQEQVASLQTLVSTTMNKQLTDKINHFRTTNL